MAERGLVRTLEDEGRYYLLTGDGRDYVESEVDQDGIGYID
jgi:hypothetical protein